jgi:hypothetical protein
LSVFAITYSLQLWDALHDANFQAYDSASYLEASDFLYNKGEAHVMRPVGYPILLGLPYFFGGKPSIFWGVALNFMLWFGSIALLYRILRKATTLIFTRIGVGFFVLNIGTFALLFQLLSETLFTFCLLLFAYCLQLFFEKNNIKHLFFAAAVLSYSALVRPVTFNLWFLFAAIAVFFIIKNKNIALKTRFLNAGLVLSAGLLLLTQMTMMQRKSGVFTLTIIDKHTFYHYLGAAAEGKKGLGLDSVRTVRGALLERFHNEKRYQDIYALGSNDIKNQVLHNTANLWAAWCDNHNDNANGESLVLMALKNKQNTPFFEPIKAFFIAISKIQNQVYTKILLFFVPIALFLYYKKIKNAANTKNKNDLFFVLTALSFCCIVLSAVSFWQGDRFLVPLAPFAIIGLGCLYNIRKALQPID